MVYHNGRVRPGTLLRLEWSHLNLPSFSMFPMLVGFDRRLLALLFFLCRDAVTCSLLPIFFFQYLGSLCRGPTVTIVPSASAVEHMRGKMGHPLHERDSNVSERRLSRNCYPTESADRHSQRESGECVRDGGTGLCLLGGYRKDLMSEA